jgi:hypothetical protein
MASYFDLEPPRSKAAAVADNEALGKMGLMSPQVSRILEDLELEDKSSDEDQASQSGDSSPSDEDAGSHRKSRRDMPDQHHFKKSQTSPLPQGNKKKAQTADPPPRPGPKHPHFARFHSLRSMLFQSNIEANMHKAKESGAKGEPEDVWKADHEKRQGLNRPKTPESPPKEGFAHKLGNKLRRLTSKEVPTMNSIREDADNESTASDDEENERRRLAEDSEEIDHSDIEDLVRWASRRDPPSDGERRKLGANKDRIDKEDSGHESLGHSDVEDLVRWVSRKENKLSTTASVEPKQRETPLSEDSDVSAQSDSEDDPMEDEELDDLVRWVSRRDGPNVGPIREKPGGSTQETNPAADGKLDAADKSTSTTREEHKSLKEGESGGGSSLKKEFEAPAARESNAGVAPGDIDELVRWVSSKKATQS